MKYDKPIMIQKQNEETEEWEDVFRYPLHADINIKPGEEYQAGSGTIRKTRLMFELRYFEKLKPLMLDSQLYRVQFQGENYNVVDYDDFKLKHKIIKIIGEACT